MKKQLSNLGMMAVLSVALLVGAGCDQQKAAADEPKVLDAPLLEAPVPDNPAAPAAPVDINATNAPEPKVVKPAEVPEKLNMSPGLKELAKLVQAGVSEDVLLAYITNSAQPFNLGSDELVYLNDLGVSPKVQTAVLQHDSSPQFTTEKKHIAPPEPTPAPVTNPVPPNPALQPPPPADPGAPIDPNAAVAPPQQEAYASYYNTLAPYGNWVQVEGYGLCWQPTVAVANSYWRPYSNAGHWLWTDNGWYWYSDYTWGWAPFHYGRWCSYPRLGWVWVPDTVWGPSWVSWRYTSGYCGWAPLPPRSYAVSGFGLWYGGSAVNISFGFGLGVSAYSFVPINRFCDRTPSQYYVSGIHATTIYRDSTVINNYVVNNNTVINQGISRDRVAQLTRTEIPKATLVDTRVPVGKDVRAERIVGSGASTFVMRPRLPNEGRVASVPPRNEVVRTTTSGASSAVPPAVRPNAALHARPQATADPAINATHLEQQPVRPGRSISTPNQNGAFAPATGATVPSAVEPRSVPANRDNDAGNPAKPPVRVSPPANRSGSPPAKPRNGQQATGTPIRTETAREGVPAGSIVINRGNAGTTKIQDSESMYFPPAASSSSSIGRFQPSAPMTAQPAVRSETARSAIPAYSAPSPSVAPSMRSQPPSSSIAPAIRSQSSYVVPPPMRPSIPSHSEAGPSAIRTESPRGHQGAAPAPAAPSQSHSPQQGGGGNSGGGGGRGNGNGQGNR